MKTIFILLILIVCIIGCGESVSPEQELDSKLQGRWRFIYSASGWKTIKTDSSNTYITFKNGKFIMDLDTNQISNDYIAKKENNKLILTIPKSIISISRDSLGNLSEYLDDLKYEVSFDTNDTLNFNVIYPVEIDGVYLIKYVRIKQ